MARREPLGLVRVDRVVAEHRHLGAELLEEVREVVGEAVVVVDEEDHAACPPILLGVGERRLEGGELAQALLVLRGRVGVGDDPRAGLETREAVGEDDRADRDAGVERPVRERVADRARVRARAGGPRARR